MNGLAERTNLIIVAASIFDCLKDFTLIGGTGLSLKISHRLNEDLDFCVLSKKPGKDRTLNLLQAFPKLYFV